MSAGGSNCDDESSDTSINAPTSLWDFLRNTAINIVPPLVAYYGLRLFGVTEYLALVGAIVVATVQGSLAALRKRKFEPLSGVVIVVAACSLTLAFTTKDPRAVQVMELAPASLLIWAFLASGLLRKPFSLKVVGAFVPRLAENALPQRGWTQQDIDGWHRLHIRLCVWLGILCGVFPFVAVFWIFRLSVDVSQILIITTGNAVIVLAILSSVAVLRRFVRQRGPIAAPHADTPANASPEWNN
ncbi:VC0807 family protein [Mycolicibacterium tusciae]|uniref:VC0807 family protein n=1 Tax=Mycolicibacterium tusciae TaxID=75922 RepID=UPI00024A2AC9|nr:VC0807 family protein [Mycolicibacterium tusciae]